MPEITGGEIIDPSHRPFLTYHFATGTAGTPLTLIPRYTLPSRCLISITSHLTISQDYPDSGAQLCVAGDITPVTLSGEPQCRTQSQSTGGTIVGTDGTVLLSASQGTNPVDYCHSDAGILARRRLRSLCQGKTCFPSRTVCGLLTAEATSRLRSRHLLRSQPQ